MQTLIIEVSGGVVQEVYTDAKNLCVIKVDWDVGESPGDEHWTVEYTTAPLFAVPVETGEAIATLE